MNECIFRLMQFFHFCLVANNISSPSSSSILRNILHKYIPRFDPLDSLENFSEQGLGMKHLVVLKVTPAKVQSRTKKFFNLVIFS